MSRTELSIDVGDAATTFATGDFLNAVNQVICYFSAQREINDTQMMRALRILADDLEAKS